VEEWMDAKAVLWIEREREILSNLKLPDQLSFG
jgi:hypothetical protein